jgi:hypothetical protein
MKTRHRRDLVVMAMTACANLLAAKRLERVDDGQELRVHI